VETRELPAGGLTFRAREHGAGAPVLLLHGFPETSIMWVPLMERLAGLGFHCLAPDQRGYSPGARPEDPAQYGYDQIAGDVFAFMDAMAWPRAHLIGHDWGALAGWAALDIDPARVLSWTALSVPHPMAFRSIIEQSDDQRQKSGYIQLFQQAGVAENVLSANEYQPLRNLYATHSREEAAEYIDVLSQDGALTGALNWYRTAMPQAGTREWRPVATPTLHVWGRDDMAVGREATEACRRFVTGPYQLIELACGHWIVQEALDEVTPPVVAHLKKHG
jgi:pimeloyl-ACP methyl ester carboxylesterase